MDILSLGHASFKIKGKTKTVITDPYNPEMVGIKLAKQEADIVTVSHDHPDHNYVDMVSGARTIEGPGEYEVGGVSILGYATFHDDEKGAKRGKNTIFLIEIDGVRILHLGDLGHSLPESLISEIGLVDILFVPVGGFYTIDGKEAIKVISSIGAKINIPMHYKEEGAPETFSEVTTLEDFLKLNTLRVERTPKLSLKDTKSLNDEQIIYVLERK